MKAVAEKAERALQNEPTEQRPGDEKITRREFRIELRALRNELRLLLVLGIFGNSVLVGLHLPEILTGSAVLAFAGRVLWVHRRGS